MRTNEFYWEDFLDLYLEDRPFEDLLEQFDVTPHEAFEVLIDRGLIDEEVLKEVTRRG
jgi:hypothetical protein